MTTAPEVDDQVDDETPAASVDLLSMLTIDELNTGSRHLKASLVISLTQRTQDYERATAILAWLHARRAEPAAKLADYMGQTFEQVNDFLDATGKTYQGGDADPFGPDQLVPIAHLWGCTPAQLRACTFGELEVMVELLHHRLTAARERS